MPDAICLKCGAHKRAAWKPCLDCDFDPAQDDESLVRSVYLSVDRYDSPEEQEEYRAELSELSRSIAAEEHIHFDDDDLERLRQQRKAVESVTWFDVGDVLFRLFLPGFLFLLAVIVLWILVRTLLAEG